MALIELVEKLKDFGLLENEAKVYLTLVATGPLRPSDIAEASGVARAEVHRHLRTLQKKGFCVVVIGKAKKYSAISPSVTLSSIVEGEKIRRDLMIKRKDEILSSPTNLNKPEKPAESGSEKFQILKDNEVVLKRVAEMIFDAKVVARVIAHEATVRNYISRILQNIRSLRAFENRKEGLQANVRVMFVSQSMETGNLRDVLKEAGVPIDLKIKWMASPVLATLPDSIIADENGILIRIIPTVRGKDESTEPGEVRAIWTNVSSMINPFITLFDENWNNASDFDAGKTSDLSVLRGAGRNEKNDGAEKVY